MSWRVLLEAAAPLVQVAAAGLAFAHGRRGTRGLAWRFVAAGILAVATWQLTARFLLPSTTPPAAEWMIGELVFALLTLVGLALVLARDEEASRANRALADSEKRLRFVLDRVAATYLIVDDGRITFASRPFRQLFGVDAESAIGMEFSALVEPASLETYRERYEATPESVGGHRVELAVRRADTEPRWVEATFQIMTWEGKPAELACLVDITERKRTEEALRDSELQFRTLAETTGLGIVIVQDEHFIYANPATEELTGYSTHELSGMEFWELVHPDDRELVRQRAAARLAGTPDLIIRYDIRGITKGGEERWFALTAGATVLGGKPALVASIADITEEHRLRELQTAIYEISEATQATGNLEELFRSIHAIIGRLMDTKNFYIALYDPLTNMLSFPYFVDELDQPPAPHPLGRGLTAYVLRHGRAELVNRERVAALHAAGEIDLVGNPSVAWLGVPLRVRDRVIGVLVVQSYREDVRHSEADKEVLSYVSAQVAQAIERKRAEEALREDEERFRGAFDDAATGMALVGLDGRLLRVNRALCETVGYAEAELLSKTLQDITHPDDLAHDLENIHGFLKGSIRDHQVEKRYIHSDGHVVWVLVTVSLVRDIAGHPLYFVEHVNDLTDRKRLEEQLVQAQKMQAVGSLAGGVAHDFNNILQALLSQTQLLSAHADDPDRVKALGLELGQQIDHGASLTRQLLLFSRRETTRPELLDLNEAVRSATRMLRRLVRANIAVEIELAPDPLPVAADRGQLEQVLMNLTLNASDAMPAGGGLFIRTGAVVGERVWLTVEDTGVGIHEAIIDRIFEPFFTTKGAAKGTGLGLSVVHGIVTRHGGTIEVESAVGRGTTFRVILPRAGAGEYVAAKSAAASAAELPEGKGERILLVEDEDAAREGLRDILQGLGYEVIAAASAEEALTLPEEASFDVLLTDLMLPGMSGPQLAAELQGRWPSLRVVLMSGYTEDETVRHGVTVGSVRFLQKPFDMKVLACEMRAALDQPLAAN